MLCVSCPATQFGIFLHTSCPVSGQTAVNLAHWRPPVLAYKIDKGKEQTKLNTLFLLSPALVSLRCFVVSFTSQHVTASLSTGVSTKGSIILCRWQMLWVERWPCLWASIIASEQLILSFDSPLVLISTFKAVSLFPVSQSLSSTACTCSCITAHHLFHSIYPPAANPGHLFCVLHCAHFPFCRRTKSLTEAARYCIISLPGQASPTTLLGSNKIENKQTG